MSRFSHYILSFALVFFGLNNYAQTNVENTLLSVSQSAQISFSLNTDIDGDSDEDVVIYDNSSSKIYLLEHVDNSSIGGSNIFEWKGFAHKEIATSISNAGNIVSTDIDGDGDKDLITNNSTNIIVLSNDGSENFTASNVASGSYSNNSYIDVKDMDGDGDIDFCVAESSNIAWYENNGNLNFTRNVIQSSYGNFIKAVDCDNDSDIDFFYSDGSNLYLLIRQGNGTYFNASVCDSLNTFGGNNAHPIISDFNGDGFVDFVAFTNSQNGGQMNNNPSSPCYTQPSTYGLWLFTSNNGFGYWVRNLSNTVPFKLCTSFHDIFYTVPINIENF